MAFALWAVAGVAMVVFSVAAVVVLIAIIRDGDGELE